MLLIFHLRVKRRLVTKGRLVRKSRKGSLNGEEIYVKWKLFPLEQIKGFQLQRKLHDGEFMMNVSTKKKVFSISSGSCLKFILEIDLSKYFY